MLEQMDLSMVTWARAQFALTAMFHWIFVPLTLGLSFLVAFFETYYVKTGDEQWKRITKFWMTLFGINFAIGIATGIILEFEFGTNWSNYSWMVGDIFGAPLAIEGIFAFFIEATFFAVMFFGWDRISKGMHLFATWMVAIGSNLSAVWILVANSWMQHPVGMSFNPDTVRFEMHNFLDIVFSPFAVSKFTHATTSSFQLASFFVITVSCWFLMQKRHLAMAKKSIVVASVFGLLASGLVLITGDEAAHTDAHVQPMKLAAMEGLYKGHNKVGLVAMGVPTGTKKPGDSQPSFLFNFEIPGMLSFLANRNFNSFVPGIDDLVYGNSEQHIEGVTQKMAAGKQALAALMTYKQEKDLDPAAASAALADFDSVRQYLGYGYLLSPQQAVPPVPLTFYAFRVMVILGTLFPIIFLLFLIFAMKDTLEGKTWLLRIGLCSVFLAYLASQAGWVVAEVGRQPWAIHGLLPVNVARSNLTAGTVQSTFFMFLILFTVHCIAEIKIMLKQITIGPKEERS
ncbi:MAG: cytochrome ubiquinol oxidase subunit I [Deltaproteobacteria bacterium]